MFMKNRISRIMAISTVSLLAASGTVNAETATGTTSVTVQNGFDLEETTPLSFGTVVAIANSNVTVDPATLTVDSDGVTADTQGVSTSGTASIVPIVAGTPGTFTVSNAAPNTLVTITLPTDGDGLLLEDPSGTDDTDFTIDFFERTIVTSGTAFTADTDDTGTLVFNVGATLGTGVAAGGAAGTDASVPYENVTFTGSYTVMVEY